ncbi:MAG: hypothetical protein LBN05_08605 [Oscillospiraceae bacterium]|jgi:hypothetical protein|nr:hypothetical protein [Oscillospiraceae bacterium]
MPEQAPLFTVATNITKEEYLRFARLKTARVQHGIALVIGMAAVLLLLIIPISFESGFFDAGFFGIMLVLYVLYVGLFAALFFLFLPYQQYRIAEKTLCPQQTFTFYDTFVTVSAVGMGITKSQSIDYHVLSKAFARKHGFYFFFNYYSFDGLILPKATLSPDQIDWLNNFLRTRLNIK